jgi:SAM-dependent methyltransferase
VYKKADEISLFKSISKRLSEQSLFRKDLKNFFRPIDYTRTAELPVVLKLSNILKYHNEHLQILDISSPQILSAALAGISKKWDLIYVNPFQPELEEMQKIKSYLSLENISTIKIDITDKNDLKKLANNFDFIFSASVFEHIYPEDGGDLNAVSNIRQLLNTNGIFIFSVPFYKSAFNEYKFGDVYGVKAKENEKIFFQRFYDEEKLFKQLIDPSGLMVQSITFIGERFYYPNNINKRFAQQMHSKVSSVLFGKSFFMISKFLFAYSDNYKELKKPYIAVVALRKK